MWQELTVLLPTQEANSGGEGTPVKVAEGKELR
jgi:hypothetical protein